MSHDLYAENLADKICDIEGLTEQPAQKVTGGFIQQAMFHFRSEVDLESHGFFYININDKPVKIQVVECYAGMVTAIRL